MMGPKTEGPKGASIAQTGPYNRCRAKIFVFLKPPLVPLEKSLGFRVCGDLILKNPKPYSIYLRGTMDDPVTASIFLSGSYHKTLIQVVYVTL